MGEAWKKRSTNLALLVGNGLLVTQLLAAVGQGIRVQLDLLNYIQQNTHEPT